MHGTNGTIDTSGTLNTTPPAVIDITPLRGFFNGKMPVEPPQKHTVRLAAGRGTVAVYGWILGLSSLHYVVGTLVREGGAPEHGYTESLPFVIKTEAADIPVLYHIPR